ncbi:probable WRKY transcription factor 51 [Oryza brachyantha]|uniref:probable WRKY transcription factor 51 n=1 Tax=Oryza brachyantha TaxID=4533 RepID=UPI001ADC73A8|nr:probable WRKY transcription factor 51 [Oryza brachyantha]
MAASVGLNPEAFFSSSCSYSSSSSPFMASYGPELRAATTVAVEADFFGELDFDYSLPAPVFTGSGDEYPENNKNIMMMCGNEEKITARVNGRIGFRMRSEVEILDDGFKWRKYGKKAVKNSPNPRNYYRCSTEGCNVKKRVERDREDHRYVITTYDGVHNHASPAAALQYAGDYYTSPPGSAGSPPSAAYSAGSLLF